MKNCSNCGKPLEDGASVCEACGAVTVETPAAASPPAQTACPHCGKALHAVSRFCPSCGKELPACSGPVETVPAPRSKRGLIAGIAAAAVAVLLAVIVFGKLVPSLNRRGAAGQFVSSQKELLDDGLLSPLEKSLDAYGRASFSTDMTLSVSVDEPEIEHYLSDSSILMKVDVQEDSMIFNGLVRLMGRPLLAGDFAYDKGMLEVCLPDLSDSRYVMDLSEMMSRLGGQKIDLSVLKRPRFSGKEWRSLAETYLDIIGTMVTKESVVAEKNADFTLTELGVSRTGTVYTFTPRAEDVEAMVLKLADQLEQDEDLRRLITELVNPGMLIEAFGLDLDDDYDFEDELDEELTNAAEDLRDSAADIGREAAETFRWTLYLEGNEVRMIRITNLDAGETMVLECDGTASEGRSAAFYMEDDDSGYKSFTFRNTYTRTGGVYEGELSLTAPDDGDIICRYNADSSRKSVLGLPYGTYKLEVSEQNDITVDLEVTDGKTGGTDHILTLRGNADVFGDFSRMDITINTTDKGSAQKPGGQPVDITNYTDEQLEELLNELGDAFYQDMMEKMESIE